MCAFVQFSISFSAPSDIDVGEILSLFEDVFSGEWVV